MQKKTNNILILITILSLGVILGGCLTGCTSTTPPTRVESSLFDIVTNYHPVVVTQTNTVWTTNTIPVVVTTTNAEHQTITATNYVDVPVPRYVNVLVTNEAPGYSYTTKESTKSGTQTAGGIINTVLPGWGTPIAAGLTVLIGLWGHIRSYQRGQAISGVTQEVETVREFIKALPNGATYDTALTDFMSKHQAETGITSTVLDFLEKEVSNPDAKVAAQGVIDIVNGLKVTSTPLSNITSK